jgi:hypothetical protein
MRFSGPQIAQISADFWWPSSRAELPLSSLRLGGGIGRGCRRAILL